MRKIRPRKKENHKVIPFKAFMPHLFFRQLDFFDPEKHNPRITIIGAGGIGSWAGMALAKLGIKRFTLWDMDRVEPHNVSTTPYLASEDLGKPKVEALRGLIRRYGIGTHIKTRKSRFIGQSLPPTDILIAAVDSFQARREIFKAAMKQKIPFFLDGRIGGEQVRLYAAQPSKLEDRRRYLGNGAYSGSFVPPERIIPLPCTAQQVIDVGFRIGSLVTRGVRKWVVEGTYEREIISYEDVQQLSVSPKVSTRKPRRIIRIVRSRSNPRDVGRWPKRTVINIPEEKLG